MTDDVKAAVERLRANKYGPPIFNPLHMLPQQFMEDIVLIRDQYLSEHPADDGEAIDEAWLRSVGFKVKRYQGNCPLALSVKSPLCDSQWIETTEMTSVFLMCRMSPMYDDDIPPDRIQAVVKTRGDLRRLAAALGVPLMR